MTTISSLRLLKVFVQFAVQQNSGFTDSLSAAGFTSAAAASFFVRAICIMVTSIPCSALACSDKFLIDVIMVKLTRLFHIIGAAWNHIRTNYTFAKTPLSSDLKSAFQIWRKQDEAQCRNLISGKCRWIRKRMQAKALHHQQVRRAAAL